MHTYTQLAQDNMIDFKKASSFRYAGSVFSAACITLGMFAGMHAMIKQENVRQVAPPALPFINISMPDIDETVREIKSLPTPPQIKEAPRTIPLTPSEAENDDSLLIPTLDIPNVKEAVLSPNFIVDQQPRPLVRVTPQYPNRALSQGIEGFVSLSFSVNEAGEVVDIKVENAEPRGIFDNAAKRALRKWKYQPRIEQGQLVMMQGLAVTLEFNLND